MKTMLISEFKAKAIGCLKEVKATGEPLQVSLRGVPLAVIYPAKSEPMPTVTLGSGVKNRSPDTKEPDWFGDSFSSEWEGGHGPPA